MEEVQVDKIKRACGWLPGGGCPSRFREWMGGNDVLFKRPSG